MRTIRQAGIEDIDVLIHHRLRFFCELRNLPLDAPQVVAMREPTWTYLSNSLTVGTFCAWIAEIDSEVVATSGLALFKRPPIPENIVGLEGYVMNMYTVPEWRGQGLATMLLQEIIEFARQKPLPRLWLHATERARPVYAKLGFRNVSDAMELRLPVHQYQN